jgi:glucose-6-phosphate 1-dehydrogenase
MLKGDPMLCITGDEAEQAWRVIDPVMHEWRVGDVPRQEYPAGGARPGPAVRTESAI